MKKQILKSALIAMAGVGLVASSAMAVPLGNGPSLIQTQADLDSSSGQKALETIVNKTFGSGSVDVYNDQTGVGGWVTAEGDVSSYLVSLGYAPGTDAPSDATFGIYDLNGSNTYDLFSTSAAQGVNFDFYNGTLKVNGTATTSSGWSEAFGFYVVIDGITRYTEDDKNSDGHNYAASYLLAEGTTYDTGYDDGTLKGNNDWLLAFENNAWVDGEGRDFNDGVFIIEDMNPVPEPTTMLLFGTGLAGLAGVARRKRS